MLVVIKGYLRNKSVIVYSSISSTSFPGSLSLRPPLLSLWGAGRERDPGNEVAILLHQLVLYGQENSLKRQQLKMYTVFHFAA